MTIPSLDKFFRNQETGRLKEIMGFVDDNGPSEAPASFLVQMLLVCLLKFLDLDKITQRSFAEYFSKRNPVEQVHPAENNALSSHGPFSSKMIQKNASPGRGQHKENMESMAREVMRTRSAQRYERKKFLAQRRLCFNCTNSGHQASKCGNKYSCRNCGHRHHTSICD